MWRRTIMTVASVRLSLLERAQRLHRALNAMDLDTAVAKDRSRHNPFLKLTARGKKMTKLIVILLLAFVFGCLPPVSRRSCSELEADPSVSLGEFYSHCRAHSNVN